MNVCIETNSNKVGIAKEQCPKNYHIEFTRNGYVLYVLNGYHYDIDSDLCFIENKQNKYEKV